MKATCRVLRLTAADPNYCDTVTVRVRNSSVELELSKGEDVAGRCLFTPLDAEDLMMLCDAMSDGAKVLL